MHARARRRTRRTAECVGGQTDQRVAHGLGIVARDGERAPVPAARLGVPPELSQEGCVGAVRQRCQPSDAVAPPDGGEVGVGNRIAALSARDDGAEPPFFYGVRRGQRPASGVVAERGIGDHQPPTLSIARRDPGTGGHG